MELHVPDFFNRGPSVLVRFFICAGIAVLMLSIDAYFGALQPVRRVSAALIHPVQNVALVPARALRVTADYLADQRTILVENERLRRLQLQQGAALLRLGTLEAENLELRTLLNIRRESKSEAVRTSQIAEIIATDMDPFSKRVRINRGSEHGVQAGQIAIDSQGVIGQVTRVLPDSSELTLISNQNQMVPIQVLRTGLRAVVYGLGREEGLEVRFMSVNTDIRPNDVLVTSGLDGIYPAGLPVATVQRVDRGNTLSFAKIVCRPLGAPERFRQVMLLAPQEPKPLTASAAAAAPAQERR